MAVYGAIAGMVSPNLVCATTLDYWKNAAKDPTANCNVVPAYSSYTPVDYYVYPVPYWSDYANYNSYYPYQSVGGGWRGRGVGIGAWGYSHGVNLLAPNCNNTQTQYGAKC
jgi:hypothetical protein